MALMVLGVLSFTRSADTANLIAGNAAFKQAATQAAEVGLLAGAEFIDGLTDPDTATANRYYPTLQPDDANELPIGIAWASVPSTTVGNYQVQNVVERMCTVTPVVDILNDCAGRIQAQSADGQSYSLGKGGHQRPPAVYYRVTVRVTGPRNSESLVQAAFARGES